MAPDPWPTTPMLAPFGRRSWIFSAACPSGVPVA